MKNTSTTSPYESSESRARAEMVAPFVNSVVQIDAALDGHWRTFSARRLSVTFLLSCVWLVAFATYADIYTFRALMDGDVAAMGCRCRGTGPFFVNVSTMCETCSGAEIICADSRQIHVTFKLLCESHVTLSLPSSIVMIGIGLGALIGGSISDRFGRRPTLLCSLTVQVLASGLAATATALAPYLVLRLLCGIGMSGATQAGFTLATEIIGPRYRTVLTTELWAYQCVATVLKRIPWEGRNWAHSLLLFGWDSPPGAATSTSDTLR